MKKRYIYFLISVFLMLLMGCFVIGIIFNEDAENIKMGFGVGLIISFVLLLIMFVIIGIDCLPDILSNNPEEDDLKVYALKNPKYHSFYRGQSSHPLGNTGAVSKLHIHSRFSLSSNLKKFFIILFALVLIAFPTIIIIFSVNRLDESDSALRNSIIIGVICIFTPMIIGEILFFFGKKKRSNVAALEANNGLIQLIEKDKELELLDKRMFKGKTYFELRIDKSRGFFEISNTSVMAIILGEKELNLRDNANEMEYNNELTPFNEISEQLDGAMALAKKYKKDIKSNTYNDILEIIKNIVNEYKNRKPGLFDRLNEEIKKDN